MKLTTSDAAALLDVDESTIHRWIEERSLPSERIAGRTLLNRAAVLEWATENRVAVSSRVFTPVDSDGERLPSFAAALSAGGVHHAVPGATREEVLREAVGLLPLPEGSDAEDLLAVLLARETLGLDGDRARHRDPAREDADRPRRRRRRSSASASSRSPVDFGAADGRPVTVLFMMVTPTVHGHLHLLAALAYLLRDETFLAAVKAAAPAGELLARAAEVERRSAGRRVPGGPA